MAQAYSLGVDRTAIRKIIHEKRSVQHYPNGFDNPDHRVGMCICGIRDDILHVHMDTGYYTEYKRLLNLEVNNNDHQTN